MTTPLKKRNRALEIVKWLKNEDRERMLRSKLLAARPFDLAMAALNMSSEDYDRMVRLLETHPHKLSRLHADMPPAQAAKRLDDIDSPLAADIIEHMEPDDAADVLRHMRESRRKACLQRVSDTHRNLLQKTLRHHPHTAAGHMNPRLLLLKPDMTVHDALTLLKTKLDALELFETLFVTDVDRVVCGFVVIEELLRSGKTKKIKTIMHQDYFSVDMADSIEDVVDAMRKYDILAMPVLDEGKHIEGIITLYDVLDIIQEESRVDTLGFVGLRDTYKMSTWYEHLLYRIKSLLGPALLFTLIGVLLGGMWQRLDEIPPVWILLPLILMTTAVAASQSLATTIADLHLDKERIRHVLIDTWLGAGMALIVGTLTFLIIIGLDLSSTQSRFDATVQAALIALVVFIGILFASFLASVLPAALKALGRNPSSLSVAWLQAGSQLFVIVLLSSLIMILIS
ncbi:MAG: magnesium transporter [Acholeplasmatales bacterium]|nr:MAG: magnesium transporter [Acholeplasmatales bacterium]